MFKSHTVFFGADEMITATLGQSLRRVRMGAPLDRQPVGKHLNGCGAGKASRGPFFQRAF